MSPFTVQGQANYATPFTFTTMAGLGGLNNNGTNDGVGNGARFRHPWAVAADSMGNLYVTDQDNHTIRKLTPVGTNWVVTTLAGQPGNPGSADGTNCAAQLYLPVGLGIDGATNLYVADQGNGTIRKVTPSGTNWVVTTLAGQVGNIGAADGTNGDAQFNGPQGIAMDSATNIYVTDYDNDTIRKITPSGTNWVVTTLAGSPGLSGTNDGSGNLARFNNPSGIAHDNTGILYVADYNNFTIRKVTPEGTNWAVITLAGQAGHSGLKDGTGNSALFFRPNCLTVDGESNLYVADQFNDAVRIIRPTGTNWTVSTLAGGISGTNDGTGSTARFWYPAGVAVDGTGNLYVADQVNNTFRRGFLAGGRPVILTNGTGLALSNNSFGFNLTAAPSQAVVVDASTDLVTWSPVWTNTVGPGVLPFTDSQSGSYSNHFYRARLP